VFNVTPFAQLKLSALGFDKDSMEVEKVILGSDKISLPKDLPVASFIVNKKQYTSSRNESKVNLHWQEMSANTNGLRGILLFTNVSTDTITLENVVPFGVSSDHIYITGKGDHELSRTHLFVPGKLPVNVIVPDNAWDLGYCSFNLKNGLSVTGLVRRNRASIKKGTRTRFETILYPGGSITYNFYAESAPSKWQDALAQVFQGRMLYDVEKFDNSLFE
jgi:hypothetical protein